MICTALVTGRGNNTLENKNIRNVNGKPVVYYPAEAAYNSIYINELYISSEDPRILNAVESLNYKKILRPEYLSQPDAKHIDVIKHAVSEISNISVIPAILVVLMANTVTIKTEWIDNAISQIINDKTIDSVVPVYQEQNHHPYRAKKINHSGFLEPYFDFDGIDVSTNRQELDANYFLCHNFWVLNLQNDVLNRDGQKPWIFMGDKIKPVIVDNTFDVHDEEDILKSEKWVLSNSKNVTGGRGT